MKRIKLNLKMFEGEATGTEGATGGDGTDGALTAEGEAKVQPGPDDQQSDEGDPEQKAGEPGQETPEDRNETYKKIRNEYKDLIGRDIEKAVNCRYTENQQLHEQLKTYDPLINLLSARYGMRSGKVEDIVAAIEKDDSFYETAAVNAGMSVEQYKSLLSLQVQNQNLLTQQKEIEETRQREATYNRWNVEADRCKQMFPGFDMEAECQNAEFVQMLGSGVSMDAAYKALHFEELSQGLMEATEFNTQKKVANTIRSGASRPTENGVGKSAATKTKVDVAHMSYEQMDALIERARNGETVTME